MRSHALGHRTLESKEFLRQLSRTSHSLTVLGGLRLFPPFLYFPNGQRLLTSERRLTDSWRRLVAILSECEDRSPFLEAQECNANLAAPQLLALMPASSLSQLLELSRFSILSDPSNAGARITFGAIALRAGQLREAQEQFQRVESHANSYELRSRAIANQAVVHEMSGDIKGAYRLSEIAVSLPRVSTLAVRNFGAYRRLICHVD